MEQISERTRIPLGLAFSIIGGAVFWLTTIYLQGIANASDLEKLSQESKRYQTIVVQMGQDIAIMKAEVQTLTELVRDLRRRTRENKND